MIKGWLGGQKLQRRANITNDFRPQAHRGVDVCRYRIHVHEGHVGQPFFDIKLHRIIAHREHQVRFLNGFGHQIAEGVKQHPHISGMRLAQHPLGHW